MAELSLIAKVTVILALALGATRALHRARASVRSLILASAFGLVLLLPLASSLFAPRTVAIPSEYAPTFFFDQTDVPSSETAVATPPSGANHANRQWRVPSIEASTRVIWAAGAVASLVPLLIGLWRVRALRRRARAWDKGERLASALRATVGVHRPVDVVLHDALVAPMTCGWRRPTIAMPADAPDWRAADIRQALLHELEHVRRHDWLVHILARFTCALYWFNPAAWIAWRQLSLESERACDDAVVVRAESTAYAEQLVSLARRLARGGAVPLLSMADRRTLSTRVASILSTSVARGRVGTCAAAMVLGGVSLMAVAIAPLTAIDAQGRPRDALTIPTTTEGPAFEVVSVKPNEPDDRLRVNDWQPVTGRLNLRNLTPKVMLTFAYANAATLILPDDRLLGVPEWAGQERFTIEAIAGRSVTAAEMQRMLRRVLTERFSLRVHVEQRQQVAYRLVLARVDGRLGPNLSIADPAKCKDSRRPRGGNSEWGPQPLVCTTIDLLSLDLSERLGRPVLNQTGLTGIYDGTLSYAPSAEELAVIYQLSPSELPPAAMTGPSLTTALREQLGLRLESTRAAIDLLVVDHINRPTPNDAPGPSADVPSPPAQGATTPPRALRFSVASVRPNDGSDPSRGFGFTPESGRLRLRNQTLRTIVSVAYAEPFGLFFPDERISGGPEWMNTDRFTVEGRAGRAATPRELGLMLRALLADRFNLKVRLEPRQGSIYALVRAKRDGTLGPQLRRSEVDCPAVGRCGIGGGPGRWQLSGASLPLVAEVLRELVGRPVVDRTGLDGSFDGTLTWAPAPEELGPLGERAPGSEFGASLFTALEEQFGLKLQSERGPVEYLVVEHADRPTPNDAPDASPAGGR